MDELKIKYETLKEKKVSQKDLKEQIRYLIQKFETLSFSTSFSNEDQVITYLLKNEPVRFFTLDTGRLFEETYDTWNRTRAAFGIKITAYAPDQQMVADFTSEKGPNGFYRSVENRKQCCHIRKVMPLKKALKGQQVWITGLRAEHSEFRENLEMFEWDETHKLIKFHPLLHWKTEEITAFIKQHGIPNNPLHGKGYASIGCAPCTRALKDGERFRDGRWWWEDQSKKECGLHSSNKIS